MSRLTQIAIGGTALLLPLTACAATTAQWGQQWGRQNSQSAYSDGFERGQRAGFEDARRGDRFQFSDESDYREVSRTRPRDNFGARYRDEFLRGFETGYRNGFEDRRFDRRDQRNLPPWSNGGGYGRGRYDNATQYGYEDGYQAGLNDAKDRNRFDPVGESRYRSGDRGYERNDGAREDYRARYRDAFRRGYEQGFYGRYR
jgi:hypothetical protein